MLDSFPTEFREGMAKRALKLGDFGDCAPAKWAPPFDQPDRIHVIASVYATEWAPIEAIAAQVAKAFNVMGWRDGSARVDAECAGPGLCRVTDRSTTGCSSATPTASRSRASGSPATPIRNLGAGCTIGDGAAGV